ncbi:MAG: DNA-directed RNA polymerase subunit omega [Bilifractor sp.]
MIHPSYKEMISKINEGQDMDEAPLVTSRYSIVIAAARRARQIVAGDEPMVEADPTEKPLTIAVRELYEDKVHILRKEEAEE